MQATWLIILGISIRVGIDVARYAALRANRQSEKPTKDVGGNKSAGAVDAGPSCAQLVRFSTDL
jgi:hypothetical protein